MCADRCRCGESRLVSFIGFSLGNNLGAILAATPIRFRYYSQWGFIGAAKLSP